jgi:hypothetical protein
LGDKPFLFSFLEPYLFFRFRVGAANIQRHFATLLKKGRERRNGRLQSKLFAVLGTCFWLLPVQPQLHNEGLQA